MSRAAILLGVVLAVVIPAGAATTKELPLHGCALPGGTKALCGRLGVPENRTQPDGRRISLRVAVIPARERPRQPDPLVYITGGPGGSAVDGVSGMMPFFSGINAHRDVVLVDQRGTGGSTRSSAPCPAARSIPRGLSRLHPCLPRRLARRPAAVHDDSGDGLPRHGGESARLRACEPLPRVVWRDGRAVLPPTASAARTYRHPRRSHAPRRADLRAPGTQRGRARRWSSDDARRTAAAHGPTHAFVARRSRSSRGCAGAPCGCRAPASTRAQPRASCSPSHARRRGRRRSRGSRTAQAPATGGRLRSRSTVPTQALTPAAR